MRYATGMRQIKLLLILLFVTATAASPWLLYFLKPLSGQASNIAIGLICLAILIFIVELVYFKAISKTLGQPVNEITAESSFSFRRLAYLLFVYASIVAAVLGLLALLNSR